MMSREALYLLGLGWVLSPQGRTPGWYFFQKDGTELWFNTEYAAYARQKIWEADGKTLLSGLPYKDAQASWERRIDDEVQAGWDMVNSPAHYNQAGIEVIDVIEAYAGNNYHKGNVLKYVCRSQHKHNELEDLRKARWYLDRLIRRMESESN